MEVLRLAIRHQLHSLSANLNTIAHHRTASRSQPRPLFMPRRPRSTASSDDPMASRWATDSAADAELETRRAQVREQKRLKKTQRTRQPEAQQPPQQETQKPAITSDGKLHDDTSNGSHRPLKRRRLTPPPPSPPHASHSNPHPPNVAGPTDRDHHPHSPSPPPRLPRPLDLGGWTRSRSVECYEKLNDIEEGTYGWVARGRERATGAIVALKRLKLEPDDRGGLPVTGLREMQILWDCSHPNVVSLREVVVGDDLTRLDNSIFLVLDFVEHDIKGILDDMAEPFLASEVKQLLLQLASGVAYLHDRWILHRDLKTSNLLLDNRGCLRIADFGMARYVGDPPPPRLTRLVVTLWYRAPELLLGAREYGSPVDMWSVGCIFAELLTREPLLQGSNEVAQIAAVFELCGLPTEESWPSFRRLPNAASLKLPSTKPGAGRGSAVRARFPTLTTAGAALLDALLALDPARRPSAADVLRHEYFSQDPKPKPHALFPTFPSRAGQEQGRRRREPYAPRRGASASAAPLGELDLSGIFHGRDKEERGAGFTLRMA